MGQNYEKHEENYDDSLNLNKVFQRKNRVDKKRACLFVFVNQNRKSN